MISELIICFFIATFVSFVGSLQLGPVNLSVVNAAHRQGFKPALHVAVGGIIPEIIYSCCAIWFSVWFVTHSEFFSLIRFISIPFFLTSGIIIFFGPASVPGHNSYHKSKFFLSGFISGMLNPMLFAFWFMVINYLASENIVSVHYFPNSIAFVIGTATGAFLLLLFFAFIAYRKKGAIDKLLAGKLNKVVGIVFIILAATEIIR